MALRNHRLAALALFAVLSVAHTWPLTTDLNGWSRFDNADAQLNAWTITWVARTVVKDPLHLFDANIFHPEADTLAYSEHLFVQGVMAAPFVWLGASPLLAYNLVLLLGLTLTGWTTSLVLTRWTGSGAAGVLAGSLVAFNTHVFTRLTHLQAVHVEFLPLAWWALDRTIAEARARHALALAASFTLQALCSGYLLVLGAVSLVVSAAVRAREWLWPPLGAARRLGLLAGAALLSLLALVPFLLPYARVRAAQGLVRRLDEVARYSAELPDYVTTVARLHYALWSARFYEPGTDALFPGVLALLLAAYAILTRVAWRNARARMLLALSLAGFALSFGPAMPGYATLHAAVPLFQGIRGAARFGYLALMGVAGLAAFGLATALEKQGGAHQRPARGARRALILGVAAIACVNAEAWTAPFDFTVFRGPSPVYRAVAREPAAVLAEFPFPPPEHVARNSPYVLASAYHLRPLVNGYSGFLPPSYAENARELEGFPDQRALARLRALGVTHVVVHFDQMPDPEVARQTLAAELAPVAVSGDVVLYQLRSK